MQDIQNIPNPDVNSNEQDDFGNHSETDQNHRNTDLKQKNEEIPVPPDGGQHAPGYTLHDLTPTWLPQHNAFDDDSLTVGRDD